MKTINLKLVAKWAGYFIPALFVELACYVANPFVALFTVREMREDRVKQHPHDDAIVTIPHDYLINPLRWFQTHDNAVDEWWYGAYNTEDWLPAARSWTQADYDNSWWIRYYCRVKWLYRNNAYGFLYNLFSVPVEDLETVEEIGIKGLRGGTWSELKVYKSSFQYEVQKAITTDRYLSINIGWKSHKGFPKKMYANRFIGFRKYK